MYLSPSQFSIVKGEKLSVKLKHYSLFHKRNNIVSNLQFISVVLSIAVTLFAVAFAYEYSYLNTQTTVTDFIVIGSYFLGFTVWATLYLLILNKVEHPRYLAFVKELKTNEFS